MSHTLKRLVVMCFVAAFANLASAAEPNRRSGQPRVQYQQRTQLDFEGIEIEGRLKNPAEFYFKFRESERFDSLLKRRKNFHREMMRDSVLMK